MSFKSINPATGEFVAGYQANTIEEIEATSRLPRTLSRAGASRHSRIVES
jgi:hypothetical protein